jgi:hypothetical protein
MGGLPNQQHGSKAPTLASSSSMPRRAPRILAILLTLALPGSWGLAQAPGAAPAQVEGKPRPARNSGEGLRYLVVLRLRGEEKPWETRFIVVPTPPIQSHNKVKKPRLGGWRLESDRSQGTPNAHAFLLARAERLLYLSGPAPQTDQEPFVLRFGTRSCNVWRVQTPKGVKAAAYLAELSPNLLALCDLSASFDKGEIQSIELHLEGIGLKPGMAPPEDGTALLTTLQRWSATGTAGEGPSGGGTEGVQ